MKDIQEYKDKVKQEFEDWYRRAPMETLTDEEISHVTSVGVSVLQTRDGGIPGGSFVQAIVKNDLSGSYNRADSTNRKVIPFYIILKDHVTI
jgi:carbamoylphosphate synthase large subunit